MLKRQLPTMGKQRGISLLITLIVLIPMTLAAIALTRSVDTAGIISGNLAFKRSAPHSADVGIEQAIAWLEANKGPTLYNSNALQGYAAFRQDPAAGQTWDAFWTTVLIPAGQVLSTGTADAAGNQVAYAIHRLCNGTGDPGVSGTACSTPPSSTICTGNSMGVNPYSILNCSSNLYYYRITVRVDGPRNTVSYVQVTVAMSKN